jgi:probable dihydroxyacetone kinase regulator
MTSFVGKSCLSAAGFCCIVIGMAEITKTALASSFRRLSEATPIDKITISDITEDCGVNRQTFYYHFQNIYDLVAWIYQNETTKAIGGNKTYSTWQEGFLNVFRWILANRSFVLRTYHSQCREHLKSFLFSEVYNLLISVVNECAEDKLASDADKSFIADFYKFAFVGTVLNWIECDMEEKPEIIIKRIDSLIEGDIVKAINALGK